MIRKATSSDLDAVVHIYDEIHHAEEIGVVTVGWKRNVYPTKATAIDALKRDDLFVLEEKGSIRGSGIINAIQADAYAKALWEHDVAPDKVCVLHTLSILPHESKKGYGTQFIEYYETYAKKTGCIELRIDTNEKNMIARHMYHKLGFKEIAIVPTNFNGMPQINLVLLEKYLGSS